MNALKRYAVLLSVLALAGTGACDGVNPSALQIVGNVVPDNSCQVKVQGGGQQVFLASGILDLSLGNRYKVHMMVNSKFPQFESLTGFQPGDGQLDGSTVFIDAINVVLQLPVNTQGPLLALHGAEADFATAMAEMALAGIVATPTELTYSLPVQSVIEPANAGVVIADIIPSKVGNFLRLFPELLPDANGEGKSRFDLVAQLTVTGARADGRVVSSGTVNYPMVVCNNCLVDHKFVVSTASDPFVLNPAELDIREPLGDDDLGDACLVGADQVVTNAMCGAIWGGPPGQEANPCSLIRCLGGGVCGGEACGLGDTADSLLCDSDVQTLTPLP